MNYTLVYTSAHGSVEFSLESGIIVESFDAPDKIAVGISTTTGASRYGVRVDDQKVQGKNMVISGTISGPSADRKRLLQHVIAPMQRGVLQYNGKWFMEVYPKQTPAVERYDSNARFAFTLFAPMPFWRGIAGITVPLIAYEKAFSFPWDWSRPFQFSSAADAYVNVPNNGDAPCPWTVSVEAAGEITNVRIIKVLTGEYVQVNTTLTSGQRLVISTEDDEMSVTIVHTDGTEWDAFSLVEIGSAAFKLDVGDNPLFVTPSDNATATIQFYEHYAGV